ncbi:MAG: DUF2726 domain-containing protein [Eubacteriales bacterium]
MTAKHKQLVYLTSMVACFALLMLLLSRWYLVFFLAWGVLQSVEVHKRLPPQAADPALPEHAFYDQLTRAVGAQYRICPRVRLSAVLPKRKLRRYRQDPAHPMDYALCDPITARPLLFISLRPAASGQPAAVCQGTDEAKLKRLCASAGISVVDFDPARPYHPLEIRAILSNYLPLY